MAHRIDRTNWLKLSDARTACVGPAPRGSKRALGQGFIVLAPQPPGTFWPTVAHGVVRKGRVVLREGMLSFRDCEALAREAERVAQTQWLR